MELYDLLAKVIKVFEDLQIPYLVTGSLASMAYGEPRLTNDIDIVADIQKTHIAGLLSAFPEDEFYLSEEAVEEAILRRDQFNIIHPGSGLKVDVMIPKNTAFDRSRFARARSIRPVETYTARFASPEDVIIKKMEYYREGASEKHLRDIASMLRISGDEIDQSYIEQWAATLSLLEVWNAIQERLKGPA
jgi:hypothetical protein